METSSGIMPEEQIVSLFAEHAVRVRMAAVAFSWRFWFSDCRRSMIGRSAPAFTMLILFLKFKKVDFRV